MAGEDGSSTPPACQRRHHEVGEVGENVGKRRRGCSGVRRQPIAPRQLVTRLLRVGVSVVVSNRICGPPVSRVALAATTTTPPPPTSAPPPPPPTTAAPTATAPPATTTSARRPRPATPAVEAGPLEGWRRWSAQLNRPRAQPAGMTSCRATPRRSAGRRSRWWWLGASVPLSRRSVWARSRRAGSTARRVVAPPVRRRPRHQDGEVVAGPERQLGRRRGRRPGDEPVAIDASPTTPVLREAVDQHAVGAGRCARRQRSWRASTPRPARRVAGSTFS